MTIVAALSSPNSQLSSSYNTPTATTSQNTSSSSLPGRCLWLERIAPNDHRYLMPFIAVGMGALTHLVKESHFGFVNHWQTATSLCYTMNALLIPPTTQRLTHCISHLKKKQDWTVISQFRNIKMIFQSTILFLVSTTFSAFGIKEVCHLLGRSCKPLEAGLSAILPWVQGACKVIILFQIHDVLTGWKLRIELNKVLADRQENPDDRSGFYVKALEIIKKNHHYLKAFYQQPPDLLMRVKGMSPTLESMGAQREDEIMEIVNQALLLADHHIRYQIIGIFANVLSLAAVVATNSVAVATLIFASSVTSITRQIS